MLCILEFDGASKGNPGKAGAGAVIRNGDGHVVIFCIHVYFDFLLSFLLCKTPFFSNTLSDFLFA